MSVHATSSLAESLALLSEADRQRVINSLSESEARACLYDWRVWARANQLMPGTSGASEQRTDWRYWLLLAGRGFGKTRSGAEAVREWASVPLRGPIHLVAPTAADVRNVMIEGPGGLLSCYPPDARPLYQPSRCQVSWPNGNIARTFSADEPERLRGPQCERFWADELGAWRFAEEAWDNLMFGFRVGDIRGVVTTTPKPIKAVRDLVKNSATVVTRGSTYENRNNLAPGFFADIIKKYEGTRLGRQELLAEILEDIPGALWTRALIDAGRVQAHEVPPLVRVVVAIDPAVTATEGSDETGIGAAGIDARGHVYVLEDCSQRATPNAWARAACLLMLKWKADRIVAEVNNGGDLVEANLRTIQADIPYRAVHASRGKAVRAEPVAALYEQGRVHHVRALDHRLNDEMERLEDQLCSWVPGTGQKSPDRMDWLVWAVTDLLIAPQEQYLVTHDSRTEYAISPY